MTSLVLMLTSKTWLLQQKRTIKFISCTTTFATSILELFSGNLYFWYLQKLPACFMKSLTCFFIKVSYYNIYALSSLQVVVTESWLSVEKSPFQANNVLHAARYHVCNSLNVSVFTLIFGETNQCRQYLRLSSRVPQIKRKTREGIKDRITT